MKVKSIIAVILLLSSCFSNTSTDNEKIMIEYHDDSTFDWNSYIHIEEVIPLATEENCLLSYARKCIIRDKKIIYYDEKQKSLFIFSTEGKFLFEIDALGGGDGQYTIIKDVIVSYDKKNILILDNISILAFDIETGKFQYRVTLDENIASNFYQFANVAKNSFYFWSVDKDVCLYSFIDGKVEVLQKRTSYPYVCQKFYYDSTNSLNFISDYGCLEIKKIIDHNIQTKYYFDFDNWTLPQKLIPLNTISFNEVDQKPFFKCILSAFETEKSIFVSTVSPTMSLYNICINKQTKEILSGNQNRNAPVVVIDADSSYFYGILYPFFFSENDQFAEKINECGRNEESNPLIVKFSFK